MSCLNRLIDSNFLKSARAELLDAQLVLYDEDTIKHNTACYYADKQLAKEAYYNVCNVLGFFDVLYNIDPDQKGIYQAHVNQYTFICCRSLANLRLGLQYLNRSTGDIPIHKSKHVIDGKTIHTALFDASLVLPAISPN